MNGRFSRRTTTTAFLLAAALASTGLVRSAGAAEPAARAAAAPNLCQAPVDRSMFSATRDTTVDRLAVGDHELGEPVAYDRVVIGLTGPVSSYQVHYVDSGMRDLSGLPLSLRGSVDLAVRLEGARAHGDTGASTVPTPRHTRDWTSMREARLVGDLEGVVLVGIGLSRRVDFTVFTLTGPDRIVIDLALPQQHPWTCAGGAVKAYFFDEFRYTAGTEPYFTPVWRRVMTPAVGAGALTSLFRGSLPDERILGFRLLNSGATGFTGLQIADGIARVRLTGGCDAPGSTVNVAGSIVPTLKQFPTVRYVKIYDPAGRTGDPNGRADSVPACIGSGPAGSLTGVVRGSGGDPLRAQMRVTGLLTRSLIAGPNGTFTLTGLPVGQYVSTATAFGHRTVSATVTISEDATTTQDFTLAEVPRRVVSGRVRDDRGAPVAGAPVGLDGTPLEPVLTAADGTFRLVDVPVGEYDVVTKASGCLTPDRRHVTVDRDVRVEVALSRKSDPYGYLCEIVAPSWADTDTVVPLQGDDESATVRLPFPVRFYGRSYTSAYVNTNGLLSFTSPGAFFANRPVPYTDDPNAAVYALWDDLLVEGGGSVRTGVSGAAPNRRFTLEWRDVYFQEPGGDSRVSFQIVLHENGRIVLNHRDLDDSWEEPVERGASATVGIEDQNGTAGLQYSFNSAIIAEDRAVSFRPPAPGPS